MLKIMSHHRVLYVPTSMDKYINDELSKITSNNNLLVFRGFTSRKLTTKSTLVLSTNKIDDLVIKEVRGINK